MTKKTAGRNLLQFNLRKLVFGLLLAGPIVYVAPPIYSSLKPAPELPSTHYGQERIQYFAAGPEFKLTREAKALKATEVADSREHDIPGLGSITLPLGEWKLEELHTPEQGAHAFVFRKQMKTVERITIVRFKKSIGNREMTVGESHGLCDMMADSVYEGLPSLWGKPPRKRTGNSSNELGPGHMLRLPQQEDREPLAVTNIYPDHDGTNWMNHGLIASNKEFVFLFVHTSTRILSPESIENVYFSADLERWPDKSNDEE